MGFKVTENGYSEGVQISTKIQEDLFNFRASDGEGLDSLLKSVATNATSVADNLATVKQVFLSKGVMTGKLNTRHDEDPPRTTSQLFKSRGGVVECKHGPATNLTGKRNARGELYTWKYACSASLNASDRCKASEIPGNEQQ